MALKKQGNRERLEKLCADGAETEQSWVLPDSESDPLWRSVTQGLKNSPWRIRNHASRGD